MQQPTRHMRSIGWAALIVAACVGARPAAAQDAHESYKAAIIYNIIRFAEFGPNFGSGQDRLQLCSFSSEPLADALMQLRGKRVGSRQLEFRRVSGPAEMASCDIAYLGMSASAMRAMPRGPLLISEAPGFAEAGGSVELIRLGRQIRFEINVGSARRLGVSFSSKLLRLAAGVRDDG